VHNSKFQKVAMSGWILDADHLVKNWCSRKNGKTRQRTTMEVAAKSIIDVPVYISVECAPCLVHIEENSAMRKNAVDLCHFNHYIRGYWRIR